MTEQELKINMQKIEDIKQQVKDQFKNSVAKFDEFLNGITVITPNQILILKLIKQFDPLFTFVLRYDPVDGKLELSVYLPNFRG